MMRLAHRLQPAVLFIACVLAAGLACSVPGLSSPTPIPVSTEAAGELVATLTSITPGPGGEISVTLTQEQLTSYVATELARSPDVPLTEPQIVLDDGKIAMTGSLTLEGVPTASEMVLEATAGTTGKPEVTVLSAKIGLLPVPAEVLDAASEVIEVGLARAIDEAAGGRVSLTGLTIDDGVMTAEGTISQ